MKDIKEYQEEFQIKMFKEVDSLFPEGISKEREQALILIVVLGVKFQEILEEIIRERYADS